MGTPEQDLRDYERGQDYEADFGGAVEDSWDKLTEEEWSIDQFASYNCIAENGNGDHMLFWMLRGRLKAIGFSVVNADALIWQGIRSEGRELWETNSSPDEGSKLGVSSYLDAEKLLERVTDYVSREVEARAKMFAQTVKVAA